MINKLCITNFQSHKDSAFEFSDGVNVIVGNSDAGKSSIIRALRWLIQNRPSGDAFRSSWGGDTVVLIDTNDGNSGQVITRIKSDHFNGYNLSGDEFRAIKTDVPEEIQQALNMGEINLQRQLDKPFLLDDSPGEVAKHFNKIANLDSIHSATKYVQSQLSKLNRQIEAWEAHKAGQEEELKQYDHLEELEGWIVTLEDVERKRITALSNQAGLASKIEALGEVGAKIAELDKLMELEELVEDVSNQIDALVYYLIDIGELRKLIRRCKTTRSDIEKCQTIIALEEQTDSLLVLIEKQKEAQRVITIFEINIGQITNTQQQIEEKRQELDQLEARFHDEFPSVCPLCGKEYEG